MTTYAQARIANPSPYFEVPDQVLADERLSHDDKEKVLKSMVLDADQMLEATAEGMAAGKLAYTAKDLQSALIQLKEIKEPDTVEQHDLTNARFKRIVVVTTLNQDLNREIAVVAYDMAEAVGGKVCLLNVVPSEFDGAGLVAAGPMGTAVPLVATDSTQIIEERKEQLLDIKSENTSNVRTEIEVRSGQIEDVIVAYADESDADLIVVGSANRSWLETLFDTSIARRVTKSAPCPVLVVPEPA
jgi:nucleotide-binding universal stress UspA family protein